MELCEAYTLDAWLYAAVLGEAGKLEVTPSEYSLPQTINLALIDQVAAHVVPFARDSSPARHR